MSGVSGFIRISSGAGPAERKSALGLSSSRLEIPRSAITPSSGGSFKFRRHFADLRKFCVHQNHLFSKMASIVPARFQAPAGRGPSPPAARVVSRLAISIAWPPVPAVASTYVPSGRMRSHSRSTSAAKTGVCKTLKILDAQFVQSLFVFRRDRITVDLIQEPGVIPNFQIRELSRDIHFALHLRRFPQYRWN